MQTVTEHIKLVKSLKEQSNENVLKIYDILSIIKEGQFWKSKNYYKDQTDFDHKEYSKMDFALFIRAVFGVTMMGFESIEKILYLDNGKELLLKYHS